MWISVSGAQTQADRLDLISNNLANADTDGYKKDGPTFKEYLASQERVPEKVDIPHGALKDKDFYPLDGKDASYVVMDGTHTDFHQGHLRVTENPLDIAMDGPGFLEVATPQGIRFTRLGTLKIAPDGHLVTSDGSSVLSSQASGLASGGSSLARMIHLRDRMGPLSITQQGEVLVGGESVARLSVVEFHDVSKLKKSSSQLFENGDPQNQRAASGTSVRQGMLETSNVNPVEEMAHMISANRIFEQNLKALKTYGDLMAKEVNEVGKL
jgi:flagellar basal-body rod protein FlgG